MTQDLVQGPILQFTLDLTILGVASLLCLFWVWKTRNHVATMIMAPIIVLAALDSYRSVDAILGTSSARNMPTEQVVVLSVYEEPNWIHIWYVDEKLKQPRGIKVEPTEQNKKKAKSLGKKLREGKNAFAGFRKPPKGKKSGVESDATEIIEYDFNHKFHGFKGGQQM